MAHILPFGGTRPRRSIRSAFVAPTAVLIGDVTVGPEASIWFGAVLRGDDPDNGIVVGARSSVQDNCVVHVGVWAPTLIGENVTVGHGAKFESCTIGDRTVVGMNAVILQRAVIGEECVLAAEHRRPGGSRIPPRSVVAGVPGTVKKTLEGSAAEWIGRGGRHYVELSRSYLARASGGPETEEKIVLTPAVRRTRCTADGYQQHCRPTEGTAPLRPEPHDAGQVPVRQGLAPGVGRPRRRPRGRRPGDEPLGEDDTGPKTSERQHRSEEDGLRDAPHPHEGAHHRHHLDVAAAHGLIHARLLEAAGKEALHDPGAAHGDQPEHAVAHHRADEGREPLEPAGQERQSEAQDGAPDGELDRG